MEKRKYVPKEFEEEWLQLYQSFTEQYTDEEYEAMRDSWYEKLQRYMMAHASPILKLYLEYDSFSGDEGELVDRDGSFMRDENGYPIQDWTVDENRFCYDRYTGKQLFYSDGTPVIKPQMPPELKPYFNIFDEEDDGA